MLKDHGQEHSEKEGTISKMSPRPPKRDIRSNFSSKENSKDVVANAGDTIKPGVGGKLVDLPTDTACYACDACTQTGEGGRKKEEGCRVM